MGGSGSDRVCGACGSRHVRRSRASGVSERFARALTGVGFHVCKDCGARGRHRRRRKDRALHGQPAGRPREARDFRAARARAARRLAAVSIAVLIGASLGFYTASCGGAATLPVADASP